MSKDIQKKEKLKSEDEKKKNPYLRIILILLAVTIGTFALSLFVAELDLTLQREKDSSISLIEDLYTEIKSLQYDLRRAYTTCNVEDSISEQPAKTKVEITLKFYEERQNASTEVPSLCTDCKVREVGEVSMTNPPIEELMGLKYIVVHADTEMSYSTTRVLTNSDYSKFYAISELNFFDSCYEPCDDKYELTLLSNLLPENLKGFETFKSTNGTHFRVRYGPYSSRELEEIEIEEIDSYKNTPIYIDKKDKDSFYIITPEFFLEPLEYIPSLAVREEDSPYPIIWEGNIANTSNYHYGYDSCRTDGLWELDEKIEELKITGYRTGTEEPIYEHKDSEHPSLKKMYKEDYLENNYKYSENPDNKPPKTYQQYLADHPIIFWKDEEGRLIKFYSRDYLLQGGCAKPIIYLYPESKTAINVKVIPTTGILTFTYPKYDDIWRVVSDSNSNIKDSKGDKYEYLWWESTSTYLPKIEEGFVVKYENLGFFFDLALAKAGFNKKEISDFKEFWIPTMSREYSPYFKISFLQNDDVNIVASLEIDPQPTTEIRIFMMYERLNEAEEIKTQDIKYTQRDGFTIAEWGGTRR